MASVARLPAVWSKELDCKGYRLLTEAEWEYAARGGTDTSRHGELDEMAWYTDNSGGVPHPVGKKSPNAYGLHDMLGRQWEWTWDAEDYKHSIRAAYRYQYPASSGDLSYGFRPMRTVSEK